MDPHDRRGASSVALEALSYSLTWRRSMRTKASLPQAARIASVWLSLFAAAVLESASGFAQGGLPPIYDFMVMDVCLDPAGHPLPNVLPTDSLCTRRRNLQ